MPELPEVEVIRRGLDERIIGRKILKVDVLSEKNFIGPSQVLVGREILAVRRFGKALVLDFSDGISMMIHLRMTGQIILCGTFLFEKNKSPNKKENIGNFSLMESEKNLDYNMQSGVLREGDANSKKIALEGEDRTEDFIKLKKERFAGGHPNESFVEELPNRQTRVIFTLDQGKMFFNDQRKFGFCKVMETEEVEQDKFIQNLGPEPWKMEAEEFYERLQRHSLAPIKAVILDQKVIAGVGNIYADESLFMAKIYPGRMAGSVSFAEAEELLMAIREVMEKSIESGGSTMKNYVKADGTRGDYLKLFANVFRREGEECPRCGGEILKTRVAGRGTHFCPRCQGRCEVFEGKKVGGNKKGDGVSEKNEKKSGGRAR